MKTEYQLKFYKGEEYLDIPNMQTVFLSEANAKKAIGFSRMTIRRYGATHYEIVVHKESFESKGKKKLD